MGRGDAFPFALADDAILSVWSIAALVRLSLGLAMATKHKSPGTGARVATYYYVGAAGGGGGPLEDSPTHGLTPRPLCPGIGATLNSPKHTHTHTHVKRQTEQISSCSSADASSGHKQRNSGRPCAFLQTTRMVHARTHTHTHVENANKKSAEAKQRKRLEKPPQELQGSPRRLLVCQRARSSWHTSCGQFEVYPSPDPSKSSEEAVLPHCRRH